MARADGVDADTVVLQFVGPSSRERPDYRLGGAVNADRRKAFHVIQTVEIGQAGDIAVNRGYAFTNLFQRVLAPTGDEHMIHAFLNEAFRRG